MLYDKLENLEELCDSDDEESKKLCKQEVVRTSIQAELDAINTYERMASFTDDEHLSKVLSNAAKIEKVHVGEFMTMLNQLDPENSEAMDTGKQAVDALFAKESQSTGEEGYKETAQYE